MSGMGRRPLIVLSHGNGGSAAMLGWLGEALASAGYIVAAVDHHGNTSTAFAKVRDDSVVKASLARESNSFRDGRIRGVYAIAPLGRMLTEPSLSTIRLPVRIVVGSADRTAPATTNGRYLAARIHDAQFRLLRGPAHYTFLAECAPDGAMRFPQLCNDPPGVDRSAAHQLVAADAIEFFSRILPEESPAR